MLCWLLCYRKDFFMAPTHNPQQAFECMLLIMLGLNILFFLSITFFAAPYRYMGNWASRVIDHLWRHLPVNR